MTELSTLKEKLVSEVLGGSPTDAQLAAYIEMLDEIIEYERKSMPPDHGYRREKDLFGRCRRACGGYWAAGLLVYKALMRFGKKSGLVEHKGKKWIAQTRRWWQHELELSLNEYNRALRDAKGKDQLEIIHAKLTTTGLPITLLRPTTKALLLRASVTAAIEEAKALKAAEFEIKNGAS